MAIQEMIILDAKNQTSSLWKQLESDARKAASTVISSADQMSKGLQNLGTGLTGAAVAGGALITSSTLLAARVETLGVVLNTVGTNAGYSKEQLKEFEDGVKEQGITTQAARTTLIKLAQAHIDLSQATNLARVAQDAAVIAGINSSEAYDRMIHGITTLNPLILRHMGIIVDAQAEYKAYAEANGVATTELDGLTKQQIFTSAVLEAGTNITGAYTSAMETAGKKLTSLPRHIEEARVALGELFLPVMVKVIDTVTEAVKSFEQLSQGQKAIVGFSLASATALSAMIGPMLLMASKLPGFISNLSTFGQGIQTFMLYAQEAQTISGGLSTAFIGLSGSAAGLITTLAGGAVLISWAIALGMIAKTAKQVQDGVKRVTETFKEQEQAAHANTGSWDEYVDRMAELAVISRDVSQQTADRLAQQAKETGSLQALQDAMINYGSAVNFLTEAEYEGLKAGEGLAEVDQVMINTSNRIAEENKKVNAGYYDQAGAIGELIDQQSALSSQFTYGQISSVEYADGLREISAQIQALGVDGELAEAYEGFLKLGEAEELNKQITAALNAELNTLNELVRGEVGNAIDAHNDKLGDLTETERKLKEEIDALNEKQEKQGWLGRQDRENLSNLKGELDNVRGAIEAENAAWEENAKMLLFNLAQRQLLQDGIQEGDIAALGAVAESLGIVDENTATAFSALDTLGGMMASGEIGAQGYAAGVALLAQNLANLPDETTVTIWVETVATGGVIPGITTPGGVTHPKTSKPTPTPMAYGGEFLVREPTVFVAGDRGLEHVKFTPMMGGYDPARIMRVDPHELALLDRSSKGSSGGGSGGGQMIINEGDEIINYNYTGRAAAISYAYIEEKKMSRLNNAMGG